MLRRTLEMRHIMQTESESGSRLRDCTLTRTKMKRIAMRIPHMHRDIERIRVVCSKQRSNNCAYPDMSCLTLFRASEVRESVFQSTLHTNI